MKLYLGRDMGGLAPASVSQTNLGRSTARSGAWSNPKTPDDAKISVEAFLDSKKHWPRKGDGPVIGGATTEIGRP